MQRLFVVIDSRSTAWNSSRAIEEQKNWRGHADVMNALESERFVLLGAALEGTSVFCWSSEPMTPSRYNPASPAILGSEKIFCRSRISLPGRSVSDRSAEHTGSRCVRGEKKPTPVRRLIQGRLSTHSQATI
jgi:hypothetical protein